ncbi:hypothetical protein COLO4_24464 [Corchorus olitorius]|uniref:Uncharacterized protein n=1 Tax=Corchorus olitorius TaxID=93759 RepID=A0A1R3IA04_9ROSI|nr:hypothetical protein COLO4_24464 [Corchorus olitorius]
MAYHVGANSLGFYCINNGIQVWGSMEVVEGDSTWPQFSSTKPKKHSSS